MFTESTGVPSTLSHYYESAIGPFRSLTRLSPTEAAGILRSLKERGDVFASQRQSDYLAIRRELEATVRQKFIAKGGNPSLQQPHYMIVGTCDWLKRWYREGREIRIPLTEFRADMVSFTYGDTFPAMRYRDGKPYRGQVYCLDELPGLVQKYGLPQEWNRDGQHGPERYIEAQVWSDQPVRRHL